MRKKGSGGEGKCSSKPIVKRISKEHLLGYSAELDDKAAHQVVRQVAKFPPTSYRPPEEEQVGEAHRVEGRLYPFKELRGSRAPLILPLLRAGVKETRHEFRSQVRDRPPFGVHGVGRCRRVPVQSLQLELIKQSSVWASYEVWSRRVGTWKTDRS